MPVKKPIRVPITVLAVEKAAGLWKKLTKKNTIVLEAKVESGRISSVFPSAQEATTLPPQERIYNSPNARATRLISSATR